MSEHETFWKEKIICPYCGYCHKRTDEDTPNGEDNYERECYKCGKTFEVYPSFTVTFSTYKKEEIA